MSKLGCIFFLAVFLLFSGSFYVPATGEEPETITWLILDLPPLFITKGPDKRNGIAGRVQKMIINGLKGRRSETRAANASRIAWELNQDRKVCFTGEFYGNRAFLTSVPTIALPPHNLIVLKENAEALPIRGAVRCPDTPWGRQLIQEINEVLLKIRPTPEYRGIMEDWIVAPGNGEDYWKIHEDQVLKVTE
ncbi:MAG TPA: hypothetical protein HPP90_10495 [Deltaproteobacteria bacterium]|nr:hypothetical protein [Deltaproteobacteria bacterium]